MNHACFNCSHPDADHEGTGCTAELDTIWGLETCGCPTYSKDESDD